MSKIRKCVGKEGFERINYLYQVGSFFATESECTNSASNLYTNLLVNVSKKTVQRIDIDMKRTICKGCRCILIAGVTCKVRVKRKVLKWTCNTCKTVKVFQTRAKDYVPWTQQPESLVEKLDYTPANKEIPKNNKKENILNKK